MSKPLNAVMFLVRSGHIVVCGDVEDGIFHYLLNKLTGELNAVRDNGINNLMNMKIIPERSIGSMSQTGVVRPLSAQPVDSGDEDEVTDRASVEVDVKAASEENNSGERYVG